MSMNNTVFSNSFWAWESWNLLTFDEKSEYLLSLEGHLKGKYQEAFQYQMVCSKHIVSHVYSLNGPTGETNELYTAGRGVGVLVVDTQHQNAPLAIGSILAAMLTAGNSVIICGGEGAMMEPLLSALKQANLPINLVQCISFDGYQDLLDEDIYNFAFVGSEQDLVGLNKQLALRSGAITALVSETDFDELPHSQDPKLVLRFITERTRTINITAVGGNATLLELGSDGH